VAILEVGLGGRLDATNVIAAPVACGITSLGFDHMELLGHTLPEIAREKAGILKAGAPAFSSPQPPDAMGALAERAAAVGAPLALPRPLGEYATADGRPLSLGLRGGHQETNAALAVALARVWEADRQARSPSAGAERRLRQLADGVLPPEYAAGLEECTWPGRSQVLADPAFADAAGAGGGATSRLTFYLDGAHTPESMVTCAAWFAEASSSAAAALRASASGGGGGGGGGSAAAAAARPPVNVLLFNCMKERDPGVLLPALAGALAGAGAAVPHAAFVPPDSSYAFLRSGSTERAEAPPPELSWQEGLQRVWASQCAEVAAGGGGASVPPLPVPPPALQPAAAAAGDAGDGTRRGVVLPSLPGALAWLRACCAADPGLRLSVLMTGSLYLVGDALRVMGRPPA